MRTPRAAEGLMEGRLKLLGKLSGHSIRWIVFEYLEMVLVSMSDMYYVPVCINMYIICISYVYNMYII